MGALSWADGGLATTLQAEGLPAFTPVDGWVRARPERIVAAHRAFVEAGAEIVLAATFTAVDPALAAEAVALARASGAPRVWASLGPTADHDAVLARIGEQVDGVVLETWVDPGACAAAVAIARRRVAGPVVASLVPGPRAALAPLVDAGADGVGFNCGRGPRDVEEAVAAAGDPGRPLWAKPAGGPGFAAVAAGLARRCRWVGGCCGVAPADLAAAIAEGARG